MSSLLGFLALCIFLCACILAVIWLCVSSSSRRNKERWDKERQDEYDRRHNEYVWRTAEECFGVTQENISEPYNKEEIVRIVNLLAQEVAIACVNQDKYTRGCDKYRKMELDGEVATGKRNWTKSRNVALEIAPDLADRLPHFSEFEPLKSYRAEHLQQKLEKRASS